jgi:hypothetical protein
MKSFLLHKWTIMAVLCIATSVVINYFKAPIWVILVSGFIWGVTCEPIAYKLNAYFNRKTNV